jgi:hypothetical protein
MFCVGLIMKQFAKVAATIAVGLFASTIDAQAACKSNYYNGDGHARSWRQGLNNAHGDWSRKVRRIHGRSWSYWNKAKVRDETCKRERGWPHDQWCNVEAYPCK